MRLGRGCLTVTALEETFMDLTISTSPALPVTIGRIEEPVPGRGRMLVAEAVA
jgi:hypothetical protein